MKMIKNWTLVLLFCVAGFLFTQDCFAQTTKFTYQGSLKDGASPANGNYDFEFVLYDALTGGNQDGATLSRPGVTVTNGIFAVKLDFGNQFPGTARYLEIHVRLTGQPGFTPLTPRQSVSSAPYNVKSLNSDDLGGVAASQYVQTNDSRLSDSRSPTAGSANYVQNTTSPQVSSNFNVSGSGTVGGTLSGNVVSAGTQFNIGTNRVLSVSFDNIFAGVQTGPINTGSGNSVFGYFAGSSNTSGGGNSMFGYDAGTANQTGRENAFFGYLAGGGNTTGSNNTMIGYGAGFFSPGILTNGTAIGSKAMVTQNNSLVLGSINGVGNAVADTNVGIGTTAPLAKLDVRGNVFVGLTSDPSSPGANALFVANDGGDSHNSFRIDGSNDNLYIIARSGSGASAGAGIIFRESLAGGGEADAVTIEPGGNVKLVSLGTGGTASLCRNASNEIALCSSSLRYKKDVARFAGGLDIINRLRPISFTWKEGGMHDIGLGAEEVEKVEPLLTFRNTKGEIEGVKYNQLSAVFVNAFKEQQAQIRAQQKQIDQQNAVNKKERAEVDALKDINNKQQAELDALKALVCLRHQRATLCKSGK
jgi:hypothetical protein